MRTIAQLVTTIGDIASIIGIFIGIYAIFYASKVDKRGQKSLEMINDRLLVTDITLKLTMPFPHLFISQCKKEARAKGLLNFELHPKKHYTLNQKGREFLNDLDETLQERIGQVVDQIKVEKKGAPTEKAEVEDAEIILYLDVKQLYELVNSYNRRENTDYSLNVTIGVILVFAHGGSDLELGLASL